VKAFQQSQQQLTDFIRNRETTTLPVSVDSERAAIYRRLVSGNLLSLVEKTFPRAWPLLVREQWQDLIDSFLLIERSQTPFFYEIAEVFLSFVASQSDYEKEYPFLVELMHYEWIELALDISSIELPPRSAHVHNPLEHIPQVSPLAWPLVYQYPVHRMDGSFDSSDMPAVPTCFIACRKRDDSVVMMEVSASTCALVELLEAESGLTGAAALRAIADRHPLKSVDQFLAEGDVLLRQLYEQDIIIGFQQG